MMVQDKHVHTQAVTFHYSGTHFLPEYFFFLHFSDRVFTAILDISLAGLAGAVHALAVQALIVLFYLHTAPRIVFGALTTFSCHDASYIIFCAWVLIQEYAFWWASARVSSHPEHAMDPDPVQA